MSPIPPMPPQIVGTISPCGYMYLGEQSPHHGGDKIIWPCGCFSLYIVGQPIEIGNCLEKRCRNKYQQLKTEGFQQ